MQITSKENIPQPNERMIGFDLLRSVAILLTLCRHGGLEDKWIAGRVGWVGVHLFFVLSSYLITNLLLTELHRTGKIDFPRFFIRRSLKIYPLYYLFILISVYKNRDVLVSSVYYQQQLLGQLLHVQNYMDTLWYHTWSLAAEEHFYVAICLLLLVSLRFPKMFTPRLLCRLCLCVIVVVPVLRYRHSILHPTEWFIATHYIMDSFATGALLALAKFTYPTVYAKLLSRGHWLLIPVTLLFIPLFLFQPGSLFTNSIGLSCNFVACALLLCYLISIEHTLRNRNGLARVVICAFVAVGVASYSIYLLHVPVKTIVDSLHLQISARIATYFVASIMAGKIAWYLVEKPVAIYKSRFFATKQLPGQPAVL